MAKNKRPRAQEAEQNLEKMNDPDQDLQERLYQYNEEPRATPPVMPEDVGDKIFKEPGVLEPEPAEDSLRSG